MQTVILAMDRELWNTHTLPSKHQDHPSVTSYPNDLQEVVLHLHLQVMGEGGTEGQQLTDGQVGEGKGSGIVLATDPCAPCDLAKADWGQSLGGGTSGAQGRKTVLVP
jgi:hypothetical protein